MTVHLSPDDLRVLDDGPRVQDLRLAEALGFAQPRDIRKLIDRNVQELEGYGEVCATVAQTHQDTGEAGDEPPKPANKGGRPGREYWLNEEQALLLSMFARTDNAAAVRRMLIGAFLEWRRQHRRESIRPPEAERIRLPPPAMDTPFHLQPALSSGLDPIMDEAVPADLTIRLAKVREARVLFGRRAAARVWQEMGFFVPEEGQALLRKPRTEDGRACLAWLLGQEAGEGFPLVRTLIEDAMIGGEDGIAARRQLVRLGLKYWTGGVFIANTNPWLVKVFNDTEWECGRHAEALRRLPGCRPDKTYIGDQQQRGTFVPMSLLDEPQVP